MPASNNSGDDDDDLILIRRGQVVIRRLILTDAEQDRLEPVAERSKLGALGVLDRLRLLCTLFAVLGRP